jgi:kynurenine formamidase
MLAGAGVAGALSACRGAVAPASSLGRPRQMMDLTHTLSPEFPFIPVQNKTFPFRIAPIATMKADGVYANKWELTEHVGTHLDAPCHFAENAMAVEQIPVETLMVPLVVVSIAEGVDAHPDKTLGKTELLAWERAHGAIPAGAAVFLHTGWEARSGDPRRFVNADAEGTMHFPSFSEEAVAFLLSERNISGIGIDTLSIDPGKDTAYPVHKRLFAAGKWAVECMANLAKVPAAGATVFVAPVKVRGASGAPARVVAFW